MKKFAINITMGMILLTLLISTGCDDFLSENPQSFITPSNFFQTPQDAEAAVIGGYDFVGDFQPGYYGWWRDFIFEVLTDDFIVRDGGAIHDTNCTGDYSCFDPQAAMVENVYQSFIEGMNTFSTAVDGISEMQDFEGKQALIAEAKFLRALNYFTLVRAFGPVPIIDKTLSSENARNLPRADSEEEVFELIISDLEAGVQALPEDAPAPGRATRWAAMATLAKVHLTLENWDEATQLAQEIINEGPFQLLEDYAQIFSENNENNMESIFEIQFEEGSERSNQVGNWPRGIGPKGENDFFFGPNWGGLYTATQDLLDDFEPGDERRALIDTMVTRSDGTKIVFNNDEKTPWYPLKRVSLSYIEREEPNNNSSLNFIYMRLGEVYLIAAEAENEANGPSEAYQYINPIRERAGLPPLNGGLAQEEFRQAVRKERRTELYDERKRLFDLYRWDNLIERVTEARPDASPFIQPFHNTWPIPQPAIDDNSLLTQNPGF